MQRGVGNINPLKMAKCIRELERIKGIKHGNNQHSRTLQNANSTTQSDLAEELHMTQDKLIRYKSLLNLIPELQDLVETGELKASIGYTVLSKLPKEQLGKNFPLILINRIGDEKNFPHQINIQKWQTEKISL